MAITSIKTGSSFTNLVKYNDFLAGNPSFIPSSYESIASATASGSSSTITFSSIPSGYASLQIRGIAKVAGSGGGGWQVNVTANSDSATNYSNHLLGGNGSSASIEGYSSTNYMWLGYANYDTGNTVGAMIIDIHDYASTTKNKTFRSFFGVDGNTASTVYRVYLASGLWRSTSAITSITLEGNGTNFSAGSTFALYGIKG